MFQEGSPLSSAKNRTPLTDFCQNSGGLFILTKKETGLSR